MATVRSNLVSSALYTTPMPPCRLAQLSYSAGLSSRLNQPFRISKISLMQVISRRASPSFSRIFTPLDKMLLDLNISFFLKPFGCLNKQNSDSIIPRGKV